MSETQGEDRAALIERLRGDELRYEREIDELQIRLEMTRSFIADLLGRRRAGRPRGARQPVLAPVPDQPSPEIGDSVDPPSAA